MLKKSASLSEVVKVIADEVGDEQLAQRIIGRLTNEFGGEQLYIPQISRFERTDRNHMIRTLYDGSVQGENGINALAHRFGISRASVYRIIKNGKDQQNVN